MLAVTPNHAAAPKPNVVLAKAVTRAADRLGVS